ncbi:phage DNA replication protein [gut metagenome]|uniref:Phage DNA replication protein n=1 Tax=gut metagenome TaxID=749906 RepID=J9G912_9ZZZZ
MNRIKKYKDISVIDKKFIDSTFENSEMQDKHMDICKRFANKFVEVGTAPKGIMMFGSVGTGKTHASNCIANYLMNHNKTVLVMNLGLYINKLQREWAEAEKDVLDYIRSCDLLVIDDFGVEKVSEFIKDKTFALIDARYRTGKPVIITTNLNIEDIKEKFGARISDRITEMCFQLAVIGESKRAKKTKNEFLEFIA